MSVNRIIEDQKTFELRCEKGLPLRKDWQNRMPCAKCNALGVVSSDNDIKLCVRCLMQKER